MQKTGSAICFFLLVGCGSSEREPQVGEPADQPAATQAAQAASPPVASAEPVAVTKRPLAELIKQNVLDSEAAWAAKDIKKLAATYTEDADFATWSTKGAQLQKGPEMLKGLEGFWGALSEVKLKSSRVTQSGDIAVSEWVVTGTTKDKKTLGVAGVSLMWFAENGLVKREQLYMDEHTTGMQMGDKSLRGRAPAQAPASTEWIAATNSPDEKKNVETIKALYGTLGKKDDKAFEAMLADDAVLSDMARPEDVKGKAKIKDDFFKFSKAFPDLELETKQVIGAGKYVVVEGSWTGTMEGQLGQLKASKKKGTIHFVDIFELRDGKVVKLTSYSNGAEFAGAFLPPAKK